MTNGSRPGPPTFAIHLGTSGGPISQEGLLNKLMENPPREVWPFTKEYEDVKCADDEPLNKGKVQSFKDCKAMCYDDDLCNWFAFWLKRKYCEIYETCRTRVTDRDQKINVYKIHSPCASLRGIYGNEIPKEFPPDVLKSYAEDESINFFCKCITHAWMTCGIWSLPESDIQAAIKARLDTSNPPEVLHPFQLMKMAIGGKRALPPALIYLPDKTKHPSLPKVYAEINAWDLGWCFHAFMCRAGTPDGLCPIKREPFDSGDPVYVLRGDIPKARVGFGVGCISATGFRSKLLGGSELLDDGKFKDPLGREVDGREFLTEQDYELVIIFSAEDSRLCSGFGVPYPADLVIQQQSTSSKKRRNKKKSSAGAGPSNAPPDLPEPEAAASPASASASSPMIGPSSSSPSPPFDLGPSDFLSQLPDDKEAQALLVLYSKIGISGLSPETQKPPDEEHVSKSSISNSHVTLFAYLFVLASWAVWKMALHGKRAENVYLEFDASTPSHFHI